MHAYTCMHASGHARMHTHTVAPSPPPLTISLRGFRDRSCRGCWRRWARSVAWTHPPLGHCPEREDVLGHEYIHRHSTVPHSPIATVQSLTVLQPQYSPSQSYSHTTISHSPTVTVQSLTVLQQYSPSQSYNSTVPHSPTVTVQSLTVLQ